MVLHVRLQLTYSHAWTCTLVRSRWSARPWIVSVVIQAAILWIMIYMTHWLDGCDHTWVYLSILTGWLRPCLGSRLLYTILWMAAPILHVYIMYLRHHLYFAPQVFRWQCFQSTCSRKSFHPSLSLKPHALGGICYTAFFHCPCNPLSRILEDYSHDLRIVKCPKNTLMASFCIRKRILLKKNSSGKP